MNMMAAASNLAWYAWQRWVVVGLCLLGLCGGCGTPRAEFVIQALGEEEAYASGCMTMLRRAGASPAAGDVLRVGEFERDTGPIGFMRIDGALIRLRRISSSETEQTIHDVFANEDGATRVEERLRIGAVNEEADSTAHNGMIVVTHNGAKQTVRVSGGTAC